MDSAPKFSLRLNFRLAALLIYLFIGCFTTPLFSQVAAPVFHPPSGKYQKPLSVSVSCETPKAAIYYTLDGSEPTVASQLYAGMPVLVANHAVDDSLTFLADNDPDPDDDYQPQTFLSMTIKAIAVKGSEQSSVAVAVYVLDRVDATFNVPYADPPAAGGTKHQLDIYQPHDEAGNAVLIFIHGGAWKQGDKNIYMELGNTFAGYYHFTTVVANYQLSTDPWNAVHPTHVQDVALAFDWVYRHIAEYGGDPENIYVFGQSAGGHLVSLLATDSTYLQAHGLSPQLIKGLITMSGAYDLYDLVQWPGNPLGLSTFEVLEYKTLCLMAFGGWEQGVLEGASPANFIHPDQPPFYIISLIESGDFVDMPGFCKEADNFYDDIKKLPGAAVEMKRLVQSDIPAAIVAVDFPGDSEGHWEEIYAINTKYWNSVSTRMVADFIKNYPTVPNLSSPPSGANDMPTQVTLGWRSSKNATYYRLQVATQLTFEDAELTFNASIADTLWTILNLLPSTEYVWRVRAISAGGESDWSSAWNFSTAVGTLVKEIGTTTPRNFSFDLFPNPFNGNLKIRIHTIELTPNQLAQIEIFNVLGKRIFSKEIRLTSSQYDFNWIPADEMPNGIYLIRFANGSARFYQKAIYIK